MRDGWLKNLLVRPLNTKYGRQALRWLERCKYLDLRLFKNEDNNRLIYNAIASGQPQAIGKIGSTEMWTLQKYLAHRDGPKAAELTARPRRDLFTNSGVFPEDYEVCRKYCQFVLAEVLPEMTIIGVWGNTGEARIVKNYCRNATAIFTRPLHAWYLSKSPWTTALAGKKVLVAHPFALTIRQQYARRTAIWPEFPAILPEFQLETLRTPLPPLLVPPTYNNWFDSLEALRQEMTRKDFDVVLIGAGAYSLPLAAHAKRLGKQGIHLGGATQVLFGIKGKRWENGPESRFYNEHWSRPLPEETPHGQRPVKEYDYW